VGLGLLTNTYKVHTYIVEMCLASKRQFGKYIPFRIWQIHSVQLANTGFNKIQLVAKVRG